jgi:hypothetical protein
MYEHYQTDPNLEKEGVWTEFGDFRVRIAHAGGANSEFVKQTEATFKPYQRQLSNGNMDRDVLNRLSMKVAVRTIVRGWQVQDTDEDGDPKFDEDDGLPIWIDGIHAEEGSVLEDTIENRLNAFRALPHLYDEISRVASEMTAFRTMLREEASGN